MVQEHAQYEVLKTGLEGLDHILSGGWPSRHMYLLEGDPGSGKTTMAMQFLLEGKKRNERCLYIGLSESTAELKNVARTHGWDLTGIDLFEIMVKDKLTADAQNTFFHTSEVELGATSQIIVDEVLRLKPQRVVIDSLTELKLLAQDPMKFRRQVLMLKQFFLEQNSTVLLLDDKTSTISDQEVKSIVHGIIKLEQLSPEYGAERRRLRVLKLRGVAFRGGYHDFTIEKGGLVVFPRLVASDHGFKIQHELVTSGIPGLDKLMGGGVDRGSATLFMGPAGAGKSSLTVSFVAEAAKRGEKSSIFAFDEGVRTLVTRSEGMGIPLKQFIESGMVNIKQVDPAELSPGEFFHLVRESVEKQGAKIVIIDSLNGYLNAMPEERFLVIQMHELLSYLNQVGVITFLVVAQHGLLGTAMETSVDISYLADNVVLLRYFEAAGSVRQAVSVVKKRSGPHERSIRELKFTSHGIDVGEPLDQFQGILTGTPQYRENQV